MLPLVCDFQVTHPVTYTYNTSCMAPMLGSVERAGQHCTATGTPSRLASMPISTCTPSWSLIGDTTMCGGVHIINKDSPSTDLQAL